jgi:hypothetical protein
LLSCALRQPLGDRCSYGRGERLLDRIRHDRPLRVDDQEPHAAALAEFVQELTAQERPQSGATVNGIDADCLLGRKLFQLALVDLALGADEGPNGSQSSCGHHDQHHRDEAREQAAA